MEYKMPTYERELVETSDIVLASSTQLEGGAKLTQTNETNANVSASIFDILK